MKKLQVFNFEEKDVKTIQLNEETKMIEIKKERL